MKRVIENMYDKIWYDVEKNARRYIHLYVRIKTNGKLYYKIFSNLYSMKSALTQELNNLKDTQ